MTAVPCPAVTNDHRSHFQAAIAATYRTGYLTPPAVQRDMLDEATVTIGCEAHEPPAAAETVRSVIRRNAELVAHTGMSNELTARRQARHRGTFSQSARRK